MTTQELPLCACGCTRTVHAPSRRNPNRIATYLKGHHPRATNWSVRSDPRIPSGICECGCGRLTPIATVTQAHVRWFKGRPLPYVPGHTFQPKPVFPTITAIEAAYFAAMIDGEGTIALPRPNKARSICVSIANTDFALMAWLAAFGGTVVWTQPAMGNRKACAKWAVGTWRDVRSLLTQTEPYMIIKRDLACKALALIREWRGDEH